jgi:hypothetical protein
MTDLAVHDSPIFAFTMTDLAVHDGPIFAFTMARNSHLLIRIGLFAMVVAGPPPVAATTTPSRR